MPRMKNARTPNEPLSQRNDSLGHLASSTNYDLKSPQANIVVKRSRGRPRKIVPGDASAQHHERPSLTVQGHVGLIKGKGEDILAELPSKAGELQARGSVDNHVSSGERFNGDVNSLSNKQPTNGVDSTPTDIASKAPSMGVTSSSKLPSFKVSLGSSNHIRVIGDLGQASADGGEKEDADSRSRRSRKPSQKLIELLEFEKDMVHKSEKNRTILTQPIAVDASSCKPPTLTISTPKHGPYKIITTSSSKSVIPSMAKSPSGKPDTPQTVKPNRDAVFGDKCVSCGISNAKFKVRFRQTYCNSCLYMWVKYLKKGVVPACNANCDQSSLEHCGGCRARRMYATVPLDKRVDVDPTDNVIGDTSTTDNLTNRLLPSGSPQSVIASNQVRTPKTPKSADLHGKISVLKSPKKGGTTPSSWASELQRVTHLVAKSNNVSAGQSLALVSPTKPGQLIRLKLAPSSKISTGGKIVLPGGSLLNPSHLLTPTKEIKQELLTANVERQLPSTPTVLTSNSLLNKSQTHVKDLSEELQVPTPVLHDESFSAVDDATEPAGADGKLAAPAENDESELVNVAESSALDSSLYGGSSRPDTPEISGPRVKHVSRSATIAQGEPAISQPADLRLSALPADEKCKIWSEQSLHDGFSDGEIEQSKSAKMQYDWNEDGDSLDDWKKLKAKKARKMNINTKFVPRTGMKRTPRCGKCDGCKAVNCTKCIYCKDMIKYGGPGKMKQCCLERRCVNKLAGPGGDTGSLDGDSSLYRRKMQMMVKKKIGRPRKRPRSTSPACSSPSLESVYTDGTESIGDGQEILVESELTNKPLTELIRASERLKQSGKVMAEDYSSMEPSLTTSGSAAQTAGFSLSEAHHRLMADFIDTYDIDTAWEQGVAIVSSVPLSTRVLCYLCGSGGQHQMCYCSACCEPFHSYCLEEKDRPVPADSEDWLCRNCRFCQVCGKLDDLLTCDRCAKTYHAECLGDGYMIQPTSAGVWVCNSCVKCISCGVTTPGGPQDKWSLDFSLCAACEALRRKGNYCPICGLCYSDDDWDCKMIGCSSCESWTHAKCENLPDDLYELIGYIGDDEAQYVCRTCLATSNSPPTSCKPEWLEALERLRLKGFSIICTSILDKKFAHLVSKVDEAELKEFYDQHKQDLIDQRDSKSPSRSPSKGRPKTDETRISSGSQVKGDDALMSPPSTDRPVKELCIVLNDCSSVTTPRSPGKRGRPRKRPLSGNVQEDDAQVESRRRRSSRGESADSTDERHNSRERLRSSSRKSGDESSAPEESTPKRPSRGRRKSKDEEVKDKKSKRASSTDDKSTADTSFTSTTDEVLCNTDPLDLDVRFKDVEWETPQVTFESLKESGCPLDIKSIQSRIKTYTSIDHFVNDVVRVMQGALTRSRFLGSKAMKNVLATKKLFEQEVAQLFPWCEVHKSSLWEHNLSMPKGMLEKAMLPPSSEHAYAMWLHKPGNPPGSVEGSSAGKSAAAAAQIEVKKVSPSPYIPDVESAGSLVDTRKCQMCSHIGDALPTDSGRLIYCGADDWIHVNCAIWSAEVFEEADGTLQSVHSAMCRGRQLECNLCGTRGATVGCCAKGCSANFHFMCARQSGSIFMEDKQVFCADCVESAHSGPKQKSFDVNRTVTVDYAGVKVKKPWQRGFQPNEVNILVGSLTVKNLGYILPESDYLNLLAPIDYCVTRVYWSTRTLYKRCIYTCKIVKVDAQMNRVVDDVPIADVTICHDSSLPGYTPFAVLATKYPSIFSADNVHVLRNAAWTDSYDQYVYSSDDDTDLANLTGIASALNKAARKSMKKRRRKGGKQAILYGSAAPELSGNVNDYVADMLDLVTEEELDEREVVILRDIDDKLAQEVVDVIEKLTEEEARKQGGVQAIMQSILDQHKVDGVKVTLNGDSSSEGDSPSDLKTLPTSHHSSNLVETLPSTDNNKLLVDADLLDNRKSDQMCKRESEPIDMYAGNAAADQLTDGNAAVGRPHSATSSTSLQAYSSASSADSPLTYTDTEDSALPSANDTSALPLISPPKIVITDFSLDDESTPVSDLDPFNGVKQTSSVVSHCTKDRLKSLVRKRSESLTDGSIVPQFAGETKAMKRRASLGDLSSDPGVITPSPVRHSLSVDSVLTGTHSDLFDELKSRQALEPVVEDQVSDNKHSDNTQTSVTSAPAPTATDNSFSSEPPSKKPRLQVKEAPRKKPKLGPKSSKCYRQRLLTRQAAVEEFEVSGSITITGESGQDILDSIIPSPPASPLNKTPRGKTLPGKWVFSNAFYEKSDPQYQADQHIVTRDRTPVTSESEYEEESDEDEPGRIIVPPNINCIVRDVTSNYLPIVLNAKVAVAKLPADSDSEDEMEVEEITSVLDSFPLEAIPARDISRDVRKDMINYCEESEESSSTDEEDLCKPRVNLRRKDNKVNYNEAALAAEAADNTDGSGTAEPKRRHPRPVTGKVMVNKEGTIRSRTENIPSALQRTISDAIKKARNRENPPDHPSVSQAYAGAAHTGTYRLSESASPQKSLLAVGRVTPIDDKMCSNNLNTQNVRLTTLSPSTRRAVLPKTAEGEANNKPTNKKKPTSTFLAFEISSDDGYKVRADNWNDAWRNVTDAVRELRMSSGCSAISFAGVSGLHMFGLQHTSVAYLTEQLYGARYCHNYRFKFHHPPLEEYEEDLVPTTSGCCRSEPFSKRKPKDMFSFIDSRHRGRPRGLPCAVTEMEADLTQTSARRATSLDLPMAMRFRHVKENARQATVVYRSSIHGKGLLCKRTIDTGEMIIEYAGEVIRYTLSDKREKYYESKGIGCYMFKIDDQLVVDATLKGNSARFINHSCDPNCFSKVIDVNGSKHIVIFALRTIQRGEELTYDYKFPYEELKIPCMCGAKKCRGFLN